MNTTILLFLGEIHMKKMLLSIPLLLGASAFGVVWENNPNYTPEEQQRAREHNERMRQKQNIRIVEGEKQIEALSQKYKNVVENAKKRLKENVEFQKEFVMAAGQFGTALTKLANQAEHTLEKIPEYTKEIEQLSFDYFIPVIAKYDTEVKKYLDEVNATKEKYRSFAG